MENEDNKTIDKYLLPGAIILAAVIVSVTLIWSKTAPPKVGTAQINSPDSIEISADDDPFLGSESAKVTIVEFSDFQCPFCRSFWRNTLPEIKENYIDTGKAKFVYRDFPLDFHPGAMPAAQGSECAREQGKFWEYHDKIFKEQDKIGTGTIEFGLNDLKKWAEEINLDSNKFNQCLSSEKYKQEVQKDYSDGVNYDVTGTPTIFINDRKLVGAQPFENFAAIIEEELRK